MNVLDTIPFIAEVRRNHGLEHATIHILTSRIKNFAPIGHATLDGFNIYAEADTQQVESAAHEALERLRAGESRLVVHPNCGTNLVTSSILAGLAAWLVSGGRAPGRLPRMLMASTLALLFAMPLGPNVQKYITTSPEVGDARILGVERSRRGNMTVHRVRVG